jgi:hypothetical protein
MTFALLNVSKQSPGKVSGSWLQYCTAVEPEEAVKRAMETKEVNGNKITIAVVDCLHDSGPVPGHWFECIPIAIV